MVLSVPAVVATLLACGDGLFEGTLAPSSPTLAALGNVVLLSETAPCPTGADACWEVEVGCEALVQNETARLRIGEPQGAARGTVLFMTGGGGSGFWSGFGGGAAARVLGELNVAGFRTVEIAWARGWLVGSSGALEGQAALACKPATLAQWIHDRFQADQPDCAFCATGNSGGAAQVSYMLSHYGLDETLDLVIPSGGPPMGAIDRGCLRDDNADEPLWYAGSSVTRIDRGFGFLRAGTGPCALGDETFRTRFEEASIVTDGGDYMYPKTLVHFLMGSEDSSNAVPQGLAYLERLRVEGAPLVAIDTLPGVPHGVPASTTGAERVRDLVLAECRVR